MFYTFLHRYAKKEMIFKAKAREKRNANREKKVKRAEKKDKQVTDECEKYVVSIVFQMQSYFLNVICDLCVPDFSSICACLLIISIWKLACGKYSFLLHISYYFLFTYFYSCLHYVLKHSGLKLQS